MAAEEEVGAAVTLDLYSHRYALEGPKMSNDSAEQATHPHHEVGRTLDPDEEAEFGPDEFGAGRPSATEARAAIEDWLHLEGIDPVASGYTMCRDGDDGWAFCVRQGDSTSYVNKDLTIQWLGLSWSLGDDDMEPTTSSHEDPVEWHHTDRMTLTEALAAHSLTHAPSGRGYRRHVYDSDGDILYTGTAAEVWAWLRRTGRYPAVGGAA